MVQRQKAQMRVFVLRFLKGPMPLLAAALSVFAFCSNGSTVTNYYTPTSIANTTASNKPFTFTMSLPGYPNKQFSAYVFTGGVLVGAVRSNTKTDAQGNLTVTASPVDANNCVTSGTLQQATGIYQIHIRFDAAGNGQYIYPTACASDAGFLTVANMGTMLSNASYQFYWPYNLNWLNSTNTTYFSFSGTGVGSVTRNVYCAVVDGQMANPTVYTTSAMAVISTSVVFSGGFGSVTSVFTLPYGSTGTYKYTCWIDADASGTYNTGDKIATATDPSLLNTWSTVP